MGQVSDPGQGSDLPHSRRIAHIVADRFARKANAQSPRRWFPGMTCSICGEGIRQWQVFNFDHVVPMSAGGARGRRNKRYAHVLCNSIKADRHPFSLRTRVEREAVRARVKPATYARLLDVWAGK